jgi:hypothetical protein
MKTHWAFFDVFWVSKITYFLISIVAFDFRKRLTEIMHYSLRLRTLCCA